MNEGRSRPVVLDTTVLSNFASTADVALLVSVLDVPVVGPAVVAELEAGVEHGHQYLSNAIEHLGTDIPIETIADDSPAEPVRGQLDAGEADSLLVAQQSDGTVATDDLAARRVAKEYGCPVTGSVGLLARAVTHEEASVETADDMLARWRDRRGYYAPVSSISEVLD